MHTDSDFIGNFSECVCTGRIYESAELCIMVNTPMQSIRPQGSQEAVAVRAVLSTSNSPLVRSAESALITFPNNDSTVTVVNAQ